MEATQKHIIQDGSSMFYYQPPSSVQQMKLSLQTFDSYCTLESSSGTKCHPCLNNTTSSTTSFYSNNNLSDLNHSPDNNNNSPLSGSSATNNNETELSLMLKDLETAMMEPELDIRFNAYEFGQQQQHRAVSSAMEMISKGDLIGTLYECTKAIENHNVVGKD